MQQLKDIKLLILDVDGVLTDGRIILGNSGEEMKFFHVQDGLGMKLLQKTGVNIAIITGKKSKIVAERMQKLGIRHVYQGVPNKLPSFEKLLKKLDVTTDQVAYMGDDLPDLPLMQKVAFSAAPANANEFIKNHADYVSKAKGGKGAVRELCELVMQAQGNLKAMQAQFLIDGSLLNVQ